MFSYPQNKRYDCSCIICIRLMSLFRIDISMKELKRFISVLHADSVHWLCRLKIFVPVALLSWAILVPVNWTNNTLANAHASDKLQYSNIDKLSISNVPYGSPRLVSCQFHSSFVILDFLQCWLLLPLSHCQLALVEWDGGSIILGLQQPLCLGYFDMHKTLIINRFNCGRLKLIWTFLLP